VTVGLQWPYVPPDGPYGELDALKHKLPVPFPIDLSLTDLSW
jgi:hypothetical protein